MNNVKSTLTSNFYKEQKKTFYKQLKYSRNNIELLSKSNFNCLTVKAWKVLNNYAIKTEEFSNDSTYIFEGDFNNLKIANIDIGLEAANNLIANMINEMNQIFDSYDLNYSIGKSDNGDEVFIMASGIDSKEQAQEISSKLNNVKSGVLSIVFTHTNNFENGLEGAFSILDKQLNISKAEYKKQLYFDIFGDNVPLYLEMLFEQMFSKLRLDVKDMSDNQKQSLKSNLKMSIQDFSHNYIENISNDVSTDMNSLNSIEDKDLIFNRIENLENTFNTFSDLNVDDTKVQDYVLSQILTNHSIIGFEHKYALAQFNAEDKKKSLISSLFDKFINKIKYKDTLVLTYELSKIKYVNDKYGHLECDNQVSSLINQITSYIMSEDSNILLDPISTSNSDISIVSDGISTFSFFIKKPKDEKELVNLENYVSNISKASKLLITSSVSELYESKKGSFSLCDAYIKATQANSIQNKENITNKKIHDVNFIKEQVYSVLHDFNSSSEFEFYCDSINCSKEEVLNKMLDKYFPKAQNDNSNVSIKPSLENIKNTKDTFDTDMQK